MIEEDDIRRKAPHWFDTARRPLKTGGGSGTSDGMEERVTRLETHFEYFRRDLDDIKTSLKKLDDLPTKRDLTNNLVAIVTIGLAVVAITIGGIIGGLAWLDRPANSSEPWANDPVVQSAPPR
ncbi:hypothetical protein [Brevundimonas sp. NIBR11]|uniref:hypothetical protein n=1 Tax=Brevundimonas sp. NIBR11 TaxID=3015999 RepID=UPI0022F10A97|nr:hypothetical protein [Brevundimonas sp. NIBR11]WGM31471.1 hypothetical protein KKHFBJBL_01718 [Brevundimonas sp. NIBR11]